jgi:hypothetical protein
MRRGAVRALSLSVLVCLGTVLYPGTADAVLDKPKPNNGNAIDRGDPTIEPDLRNTRREATHPERPIALEGMRAFGGATAAQRVTAQLLLVSWQLLRIRR